MKHFIVLPKTVPAAKQQEQSTTVVAAGQEEHRDSGSPVVNAIMDYVQNNPYVNIKDWHLKVNKDNEVIEGYLVLNK
jgi:hypothetical protein